MPTIVDADGISKRYRIGAARAAGLSLRETLSNIGTRLWSRPESGATEAGEAAGSQLWALRDVSFSVERGETLGIIGGNGAGKSTLLKVLSRITTPTAGRAIIRGRIASLLEVGTGFHGDLTGRENIFLNGAILGMRLSEIRRKFDEIVAFADVGRQIDTQVKHFSSGMYMRLAFAVAAHLEPEILVVDEVLAVGDEAFQRKCLGKMETIAGEGRTVLFVSHNMSAVEKLCRRVLWLDAGRVVTHGDDVRGILSAYHVASAGGAGDAAESTAVVESRWLTLNSFRLVDENGRTWSTSVPNDAPAFVEIDVRLKEWDRALVAGYTLFSDDGEPLFVTASTDSKEADWPEWRLGHMLLRSRLPRRLLNEGSYRASLFIDVKAREWVIPPGDAAPSFRFSVRGGLNDSPVWNVARPGRLAPVLRWEACPAPTAEGRVADGRLDISNVHGGMDLPEGERERDSDAKRPSGPR